jgi:hypothetical protein
LPVLAVSEVKNIAKGIVLREQISFDKEQITKIKCEAAHGGVWSDRISIALAFRLLDRSNPYFDKFAVLDEINFLEGIASASATKVATQFKNAPLFPFWHKHFMLPNQIINNIGIRWNLAEGGNKDFDRMLQKVVRDYGNDPDIWPNVLAHRMTIEAFEDRAKRGLTGHWLIFAKHEGVNYYLDLATHEEGLKEKLINGCGAEFPFLFES